MRDLGPSPRSPRDEGGSEPLLQKAFLDQIESPSGYPVAPERQTYLNLPGSNDSLENDSSCNANEPAPPAPAPGSFMVLHLLEPLCLRLNSEAQQMCLTFVCDAMGQRVLRLNTTPSFIQKRPMAAL